MKVKNITGILAVAVLAAFSGSGCVTRTAESPYKVGLAQASEKAVSQQPYRIEDVHLTFVSDPRKQYEAYEERNKSFTMRLNGMLNGTDYAANARAMKEQWEDALETMKISAAPNFDVDEDRMTMPMLAFYEGFLLGYTDEELEELGLPELKMDEENDVARLSNIQQRRTRAEIAKGIFGADVGNPDKLTARLAGKYPGLFDENGRAVRLFVALWGSEATWQGQYSGGTDTDFSVGVWAMPSDKVYRAADKCPPPGHEFDAARHHAFSVLGPTTKNRTYPQDDSVTGSAEDMQNFFMDRLCDSIVTAINKMVEEP